MGAPGARVLRAFMLTVGLLCGLTFGGDRPTVAAGAEMPALRGLSSRLGGGVSTVLLDSTEPVAYMTGQPDPLTLLTELRYGRRGPAAAPIVVGMPPLPAVGVEHTRAAEGTPIARLPRDLERYARHKVRSRRNVIRVAVDRTNGSQATPPGTAPQPTNRGTVASPVRPAPVLVPHENAPVLINTDTAPIVPPSLMQGGTPQPMAPGPPPGAPGPAGTAAQVPTPARFTGHAVTLDFQGADLRAVLRTFAEISGLNLVIDPSITGTVDLSLRDVPWDQALDIILKANKLGYSLEGTIVRIAPLRVLADEEAERRKLAEAQALSGELTIFTRPLSYAKAQDLVPILTRSALSTRGEVQVDARTNTLIIRDLPDRVQAVTDLLGTLDRPQPQVEIEARIVQTTRDFARALGVQWGLTGRVDPALGNTTGLAFPNNGSLTGRTGTTVGPNGADSAVNLAAPAASSAIGLALGSVNGAFNLDVALSALEETGKGRLLSTPRVSTQNNIEAEITQGIQIPIQTVANNTVTVQFKDAALTLRVTPQITASKTVIMRIALENASADFSRQVEGIPPINTQRAVTTVLVGDGETTVIGGIYLSEEQTSQDRVPGLHRLPLLGALFRRDVMSDQSRELLIFITPRITQS